MSQHLLSSHMGSRVLILHFVPPNYVPRYDPLPRPWIHIGFRRVPFAAFVVRVKVLQHVTLLHCWLLYFTVSWKQYSIGHIFTAMSNSEIIFVILCAVAKIRGISRHNIPFTSHKIFKKHFYFLKMLSHEKMLITVSWMEQAKYLQTVGISDNSKVFEMKVCHTIIKTVLL